MSPLPFPPPRACLRLLCMAKVLNTVPQPSPLRQPGRSLTLGLQSLLKNHNAASSNPAPKCKQTKSQSELPPAPLQQKSEEAPLRNSTHNFIPLSPLLAPHKEKVDSSRHASCSVEIPTTFPVTQALYPLHERFMPFLFSCL